MSIREFLNRIKAPVDTIHFDAGGEVVRRTWLDRLFLALVITLVAALSFGIGRLTVTGERSAVEINYANLDTPTPSSTNPPVTNSASQQASVIQALKNGEVVGSVNGSKYHYSHCPGAKQISEKNKVIFPSTSAAESAGYTLAANCVPR